LIHFYKRLATMSHLMKGKQYGLVIPKAASNTPKILDGAVRSKKPSIFNQSDSDSDEPGEDWVKKSLKSKTSTNASGLKKQAKIQMAKALEEDPTVFQYDEVYEKMEDKKTEEVEKKKEVDRKPKYIKQLLKSADIRNKEFERRTERKVQKEREAEGEMFADKESFVTGAYRKKMEEMAAEEEAEARRERMEAALDVTKQKDLSGFYRHIYRQTHGEEKSEIEDQIKKETEDQIKKETEDLIKKEVEEDSVEDQARKVKEQMQRIKVEDEEAEGDVPAESVHIKKVQHRNKALRRKQVEDSEDGSSSSSGSDSDNDEGDNVEIKKENLTAEEKAEMRRQELKEKKERREKRKRRIEQDQSSSDDDEVTEVKEKKKKEEEEAAEEVGQEAVEAEKKEVLPKIDIWKKRTVGDVLENAISSYWQRVSERNSRGN